MKRLSLQWRITLMTAALIGVTCVLMNCLIGYSGKRYMDAIGSGISAYGEIENGTPDAFDPQSKRPDDELTIIISGAQAAFQPPRGDAGQTVGGQHNVDIYCVAAAFPISGTQVGAQRDSDYIHRSFPPFGDPKIVNFGNVI